MASGNPPEDPDAGGVAPDAGGDGEAAGPPEEQSGHHRLGHLSGGLHDHLHEAGQALHRPLESRVAGDLRSAAQQAGAVGAEAAHQAGTLGAQVSAQAGALGTAAAHQAGALGTAAAHQAGAFGTQVSGVTSELAGALRLEVTATGLQGTRTLAGHAVGLYKLLAAEGIHGPRESASLVYVFPDALAVLPSGDAPMSRIPLYGLHFVFPYATVAHWLYKAGRMAHAELDLAHDEQAVEDALRTWSVDDFAQADPSLEVLHVTDLAGPVHLYKHFGYVRVAVALRSGATLHMKSTLPETDAAYRSLWDLAVGALGPERVTMDEPGPELRPPDADDGTPAAGDPGTPPPEPAEPADPAPPGPAG